MRNKKGEELRPKQNGAALSTIIGQLCEPESYEHMFNRYAHDVPMPSIEVLHEIVELLRAIIFPGYYGPPQVSTESMPYYIGAAMDKVYNLLAKQIERGHCFVCGRDEKGNCVECKVRSRKLALEFLAKLPRIRQLLSLDVQAAFDGDPAAKTAGETIFCYPSIRALTNHRIAHELYRLEVDVIPRIIGEMAHSETGIDIHPGASIGKSFFIDHGTGTVIGETSIIGDNVRIYQGVTLGGQSFPQDEQGRLVKGLPRHPIVENDVVIYAHATILGRVTIGHSTTIGGNVWITNDVPPGSKIVQSRR
ncbi:MAG: serine acetyltransferase [Proteobacteria bacterium]|nr:serine acetyltransferase [Pseudomonadota bacterium]MBU1612725.1 serine acetyltransferase [Pseudomonadota bacterium]